jgi:hypothetical protein
VGEVGKSGAMGLRWSEVAGVLPFAIPTLSSIISALSSVTIAPIFVISDLSFVIPALSSVIPAKAGTHLSSPPASRGERIRVRGAVRCTLTQLRVRLDIRLANPSQPSPSLT